MRIMLAQKSDDAAARVRAHVAECSERGASVFYITPQISGPER